MISAYDLPTSLTIGEVDFRIRYNWRAVLDALAACADPELDDWGKVECLLKIMFPDWEQLPMDRLDEICQKVSEFIDCGQKDDGKQRPKLIDWKQDAPIIIPEINKVAGKEVRLEPDIHWWTFWGWFMGVGDGVLASVINVRQKKAKHKKLEKWEQEFYNANKEMIDLKAPETEEERKEKESILKWL